MSDSNKLARLDILVASEEAVEVISGLLAYFVAQGWEEEVLVTGETRFRVHAPNLNFCQTLAINLTEKVPTVVLEHSFIENEDWVLAWCDFFTPVPVSGRFIVIPPWHDQAKDFLAFNPLPQVVKFEKPIPIIIEPKTAFGTGHHATTALCLKAIADLEKKGFLKPDLTFLDLGTGSGILAIACSLIGMTGLALDIDSLSVDNAMENRQVNRVESKFDVKFGSLDLLKETNQKFNCIIANILAEPLKVLSKDIVASLELNGLLVLSGILDIQAKTIEDTYIALGLKKFDCGQESEWVVLVFIKE